MNFKNFATILSLATLACAAPARRQTPPGVVMSCTKPGTAALTFDDGPHIYSEEVVQTLNAHNAKGTFFYNGNNYGCIYDPENVARIQNALASGHQVASHTWSHPHLPELSEDQIQQELASVHQALTQVAGVAPAFMRPPYGEYNDAVIAAAQGLGETVVIWDFDSGDSIGADPAKQQSDYTSLVGQRPASILSLEHETIQSSAEVVLPAIIGQLQSAGYQLVTVAECLGASPYISVGPPAARDGSWTCGA